MAEDFAILNTRSDLVFWITRETSDTSRLWMSRMTRTLVEHHLHDFVTFAGGWLSNEYGVPYLAVSDSIFVTEQWRCFKEWLELANKFLWPGLNGHIRNYYEDAGIVDACAALDYNYGFYGSGRTVWGTIESAAKYNLQGEERLQAINKLVGGLLDMAKLLPIANLAECVVSGIPIPCGEKNFGYMIAESFAQRVGCVNATPELLCAKSKNKQYTVHDSYLEWQKIYGNSENVKFNVPVKGKTVIIVDDLYQSGVSVWSYARFLKEHGATAVYALCCVKSVHDGRDGLQ